VTVTSPAAPGGRDNRTGWVPSEGFGQTQDQGGDAGTVGVSDGEEVAVLDIVGVGDDVFVEVADDVHVPVADGVCVQVGVGVGVAGAVSVAVAETVSVGVWVGVDDAVGESVGVKEGSAYTVTDPADDSRPPLADTETELVKESPKSDAMRAPKQKVRVTPFARSPTSHVRVPASRTAPP
jgi:hypothetical protein